MRKQCIKSTMIANFRYDNGMEIFKKRLIIKRHLSHHFMADRWGNSGNSGWLYFFGLQNHCRWWLQPWNKRRLLLGRNVMTNLDSILKSRDITLPMKFCLVKAMVFPVVMYGCESWTVKKAERWKLMLSNCGVGEDSWECLGLQGDPTSPFWRRSVLGVHWN